MKFNILIDQKRSLEWGLNFSQAAIFSLICDSALWSERDGAFWFLSRDVIRRELPLVSDKADTIYRCMLHLQKCGLIEHRKVGKRDYFRVLPKGLVWGRADDKPPAGGDGGGEILPPENSEKNPSSESYPQERQNFLPETRKKIRESSENFPKKLGFFSDRSVNNINNKQYYPSAEAQVREGAVDNSGVDNFDDSESGLPVGAGAGDADACFASEDVIEVRGNPDFSRVIMPRSPHKLTSDWRPQPWVYDLLQRNHGISREQADWELTDFLIYWIERGFVGLGWNRKFHDRVVAQKRAGRIPELQGAGSRQPFVDNSNAGTDWADLPLKKINNFGGV